MMNSRFRSEALPRAVTENPSLRRPFRRFVGLVLLLLASTSAPASLDSIDAQRLARQFEGQFHQILRDDHIPGAAFAVVHRGQLAGMGLHGHVDKNGGRAIDSATVFRIASVSKGFSGVLAAMLAGEGAFSLDQSVSQFSPSFELVRGPRALTVEDVLSQRSGFVRNAYDNLIEAGLAREEILPRFGTLEPLCPPGRCYSYQNNVFSLIEDVVSSTTGEAWLRTVDKRLFEPLGMARASVGFQPFISENNRAEPHLKTRVGWRQVRPRTTYYQVPSAAGINAGILDMAQWAIAMLGHRPDVVPPEAIDEALRPRIRTRNELRNRHWRGLLVDAHYGLGWRIYELPAHTLALHGGWVAGFRSEIALSRELDLGLVLLCNAESRAIGELNRIFWDLALAQDARTADANPATSLAGASAKK
ncbi:MAG: serine hydrolase domain-containing protein [Wenzhouxiangellaceae bacterium]